MPKRVAILATLDTKGAETEHIRSEIKRLGGDTLVIDIGVMGEPGFVPDISSDDVAKAGGRSLADVRKDANRSSTSQTMIEGVTRLLADMLSKREVHALISLGGTQGTNNAASVMRELPYGFPKIIVSTLASGNVGGFVGIKDIVMMSSVGDILGLNPLLRRILSNAAGAAWGMALAYDDSGVASRSDKPMIAITNLGVLTQGAMRAVKAFEERGFETIVFHAAGTGGKAMEQMIREGLVDGVFDYALGDVCDSVLGGLRASEPDRLTVAHAYGVPQVVVPGGIDHIGVGLEKANDLPAKYKDHLYSYHNPMILVPRPKTDEMRAVVSEIGRRLSGAGEGTVFLMPLRGVSSYTADNGALRDRPADEELRRAVHELLPKEIEIVEVDANAEDDAFVSVAVERLVTMLEAKKR
jgi:uncharacterized protein (UPF0261 family)